MASPAGASRKGSSLGWCCSPGDLHPLRLAQKLLWYTQPDPADPPVCSFQGSPTASPGESGRALAAGAALTPLVLLDGNQGPRTCLERFPSPAGRLGPPKAASFRAYSAGSSRNPPGPTGRTPLPGLGRSAPDSGGAARGFRASLPQVRAPRGSTRAARREPLAPGSRRRTKLPAKLTSRCRPRRHRPRPRPSPRALRLP